MCKKIKIAMITNHLGITGIGTVIMNYCMALDRSKYDITIIAGVPISAQYEKGCQTHGVKILSLPSRHDATRSHYLAMWKALRKGHYDIVHVHGSSSLMAIDLTLAKVAGIRARIAHSHNTSCPNLRIHRLLNGYFRKMYTKALACGILAGNWLFGENQFEVLPNGFHTEGFKFSLVERNRIRNELNIENEVIIGHVGRFNDQKNQTYLLRIFEIVASKREDVFLLMVGAGPDFDKIKSLVDNSPYKKRIILYGESTDTRALYSAMDLFVLPSKHEGMPVVLLEAQISGLPCIVSDRITKEVDFGDILWESIDADPLKWANAIQIGVPIDASRRHTYYETHAQQIQKYDIHNSVKQMEMIYHNIIERR